MSALVFDNKTAIQFPRLTRAAGSGGEGMGRVYYREGGSDCRWLAQFHRYETFPSFEGRVQDQN
jgi:hypothetical protein